MTSRSGSMEDDGSRSRWASAFVAGSRVARREEPDRPDGADDDDDDDDDDASVASTSRGRRRLGSSSSGTSRLDPTLGRCARARTARRARGGPARRAALASRVAHLRGAHLAPEVLAAAAALARASNAPMANIARGVCAVGRRIARGLRSASRRARRGGRSDARRVFQWRRMKYSFVATGRATTGEDIATTNLCVRSEATRRVPPRSRSIEFGRARRPRARREVPAAHAGPHGMKMKSSGAQKYPGANRGMNRDLSQWRRPTCVFRGRRFFCAPLTQEITVRECPTPIPIRARSCCALDRVRVARQVATRTAQNGTYLSARLGVEKCAPFRKVCTPRDGVSLFGSPSSESDARETEELIVAEHGSSR